MASGTFRLTAAAAVLGAASLVAGYRSVARAQQVPIAPEVGVFADTEAGLIALKQEIPALQIAGVPTGSSNRALVFPIETVDALPTVAGILQVLINLPTVGDAAAGAAQLRFLVGEHEREPDFKLMTVRVGKIRTGYYQVTSPDFTRTWMAGTYAKMTSSRKWKDKHPPAMIGIVVNSSMYPARLEPSVLDAKR
ncbi:MAG TPA: hypothetical protein VKD69_05450 [Vicinamibacterales bacterium]|nr:hypothetical protein [Vicinamibacterales bacterium]